MPSFARFGLCICVGAVLRSLAKLCHAVIHVQKYVFVKSHSLKWLHSLDCSGNISSRNTYNVMHGKYTTKTHENSNHFYFEKRSDDSNIPKHFPTCSIWWSTAPLVASGPISGRHDSSSPRMRASYSAPGISFRCQWWAMVGISWGLPTTNAPDDSMTGRPWPSTWQQNTMSGIETRLERLVVELGASIYGDCPPPTPPTSHHRSTLTVHLTTVHEDVRYWNRSWTVSGGTGAGGVSSPPPEPPSTRLHADPDPFLKHENILYWNRSWTVTWPVSGGTGDRGVGGWWGGGWWVGDCWPWTTIWQNTKLSETETGLDWWVMELAKLRKLRN